MVAETHPLRGERLAAISFRRRGGELFLVVVLPDGTPGLIAADGTDVFGDAAGRESPATVLSVGGVRELRTRTEAHLARAQPALTARRGRIKPWKVVRHDHGVEPFQDPSWVYSAHTTELAARRARDKVRAIMARASGEATAAEQAWSVVFDPAGLLAVSEGQGAAR